MFKNAKQRLAILLASAGLFSTTIIFGNLHGIQWTRADEIAGAFLQRAAFQATQYDSGVLNKQKQFGESAQARWTLKEFHSICAAFSLVLTLSAVMKPKWLFYFTAALALCGVITLAGMEFARDIRFPLANTLGSFSFMFGGLLFSMRWFVIKEQARVRRIFASRIAPHILQKILAAPEALHLTGEEKEVTLLCVRLWQEHPHAKLPPQAMIELQREFFMEMAELIMREAGYFEKPWGDTMFAVFGAPLPSSNHAQQAVCTALKMQRRMLELRQQWMNVGLPAQRCHFGIATGRAVLGNLRVNDRDDYTVLSESLQRATDLCRLNQAYGTALLISANTLAQLPPQEYRVRWLEILHEARKAEPMKVYEVYGDLATYRSPIEPAYYQNYEKAFAAFVTQDFAKARSHAAAALAFFPDDSATFRLLAQLEKRQHSQV